MSKVTIHEQGRALYVLGTVNLFEAREVLPEDVTGWDRSEVGAFARRQGLLRWYPIAESSPKDARVGIRFGGVRRGSPDVEIERQP